jgi:hypothetical protein
MGTLQIRVLTDLITDLEVVGPEMAVVLAVIAIPGLEAVVPEAIQATAVTLVAMPAAGLEQALVALVIHLHTVQVPVEV